MLEQSVLNTQISMSPLKGQSTMKPHGGKKSRPLVFTLMLTSLIDAFSILVIYLLVNFSSPTASLKVSADMQLPQAGQSTDLGLGTVVTINKGHYYVDDKEVTIQDISRRLYEIHQQLQNKSQQEEPDSLVVQADRRSDYEALNPIVMAASQAGFHQFKFAVLQGGDHQ